MEFGRVAPGSGFEEIDFRLQPEPVNNALVLSGRPVVNPVVRIGCPKWGEKDWINKLFPPNTKEKEYLDHYARQYNCVELNATHYRLFDEAGIKKWTDKTKGLDFMFCPKAYKGITHFGSLKEKVIVTNQFLHSISLLGDQLGPVFIQMSESFAPKRKDELIAFLESLPKDYSYFLEIRHPEWFNEAGVFEAFVATLSKLNIGIVITDTPGRRDCVHMHLTVPRTYIRFAGNGLNPTDLKRIDYWCERIQYWLDKGLEALYFIIHMHEEKDLPDFSVEVINRINTSCGLNSRKPVLIKPTKGLFD